MKLTIKDLYEVAMVFNLVACITLACYLFFGVVNFYTVTAMVVLAALQAFLFYKSIKKDFYVFKNNAADMHDGGFSDNSLHNKNSN